jgi:hypothetical protein
MELLGKKTKFGGSAEGGTRPLASAGVHQRASSVLSNALSSTSAHHYPLLSAGYGVRKGVSVEVDLKYLPVHPPTR